MTRYWRFPPEIWVTQARMHRDGKTEVLIENFEPSAYIQNLIAAS